ncbi:MAG: trypsin-like peptidase domain-containing protein [Acidobacteria bacterium]|nr:trypsin-like peptidase domain-containing protein [Acidobacteriota bacterium]
MLTPLLVLVLAASLPAAEPDVSAMKRGVVKIVVRAQVRDSAGQTGAMRSQGSGYLVGGQYVVTNNHVCCRVEREGLTILGVELMIHTSLQEKSPARAIWNSARKDLAVLQLERPFPNKPSAVFAKSDAVKDGIRVWAVGFPGAAESQIHATEESDFVSTATAGIIGKFVQQVLEENGPVVDTISHSAATNAGNSGGPLFNFCGQVVATNFAKALATIRQRVVVKDPATGQPVERVMQQRVVAADGINWSLRNSELLPELDKLRVKYEVAPEGCQEIDKDTKSEISSVSGRMSTLMITQVGSIAMALAAIGLAMNKRVRQSVTRRLSTRKSEAGHASSSDRFAAVRARPTLRGVTGFYAGTSIAFEDQPWILGRDRNVANLVFPADQPGISKRHCTLTFVPGSGEVKLEDTWSTHGTFLMNGTKLEPGKPYTLRPGDRFYLAERSNVFEIGGQ